MGLGGGFGYGGSTIDKTNYNRGNSRNDTANNSYSRSSRSSSRKSYIERKRPDSKPRGMTQHRWENPTLGSFTSSSGSSRSSAFNRPTLNYENDKESILNNAPNKQITQSYQVAENPNPFMKDVLSMGQKYNTYQRQIANPEYDEYINKKNNEYNNKYNNFRWGNYNWNNLAQNDFESERLINGIFGNPQNFNTVSNNKSQNNGSNDFWGNIMDSFLRNGSLLLAKSALFG